MSRDVTALAALFTVSAVAHFAKPGPFESIVPKPLSHKRGLVYASGVVELGCAALLMNSKSRQAGGLLSAALLIGVFPANLQMSVSALRSSKSPGWFTLGTVARLPLQYPMVRTALRTAKG